MNQNFAEIGQAFVKHYYATFDQLETRNGVMPLYSPDAILTFEGDLAFGIGKISERLLEKFPVAHIKRVVCKVDCQPMPDGILVFVFGQLVDSAAQGQDKPSGFSQMFILRMVGESFVITNEIFRLNLYDIAVE